MTLPASLSSGVQKGAQSKPEYMEDTRQRTKQTKQSFNLHCFISKVERTQFTSEATVENHRIVHERMCLFMTELSHR